MSENIDSTGRKRRAVVCGVGRMGRTIAWAMNEFGFHVVGLDQSREMAQLLPKPIDFLITKTEEDFKKAISLAQPSVVISSLPYHQTEMVAKICIENNYNYCDLGGRVDVSQRINDLCFKNSEGHVFTDLGLAPGWVNIMAEHGCRQIHTSVDSVKMMVGGLPLKPENPPLNYQVTWSIDGLINEYRDKCRILKDGEVRTVNGMDGLEKVKTKSLGELEAFYTSGGASHSLESMFSKGVHNCSYKTLRYKNHRDTVEFLIRKSELSDECLYEVFNRGCAAIEGGTDLVIMKVEINGGDSFWTKEVLIRGGQDRVGGFSAMQKATGFSISSVAKMMAEDFFKKNASQHRDYYDTLPKALSYKHVDYGEFFKNMEFLRQQIKDEAPYEQY